MYKAISINLIKLQDKVVNLEKNTRFNQEKMLDLDKNSHVEVI